MNSPRPKVVQPEPVPELNPIAPNIRALGLRPLARLRVPLTLTVRPWATLYRTPDGRTWWCLRLRDAGVVRTHCVTTERLRTYARINRLPEMEHALDAALIAAGAADVSRG